MTDEIYWEFHEKLMISLDREPAYEEVQNYINESFKITNQQKKEFELRRFDRH